MKSGIGLPPWMATLLHWLHRGEDLALSALFLLTLGTAVAQIPLRNILGTSIVWADVMVRILVLWLGMFGAMVATRQYKHICIDLVFRYLSPSLKRAMERVVALFAGVVCAGAAYFSLLFVISEYQAGEIAFALIPAWLCESILPVAFTIIALRFLFKCGAGLIQIKNKEAP